MKCLAISVAIFLVCHIGTVVGNSGIPLFLFKDTEAESDLSRPLVGHTISSDDFSATLLSIKTPELSVLFVQDQLSNEDFLRLGMDMKRGGLFKNVEKYSARSNSMFYPSVKAPVHSLKALVDLYDERIELDDANEVLGYMSKTKLAKNTAITVHLHPTADEETAAKTIAKNDKLIGEVMNLIEKSGLSYVAVFTGKSHRKHHEAFVQTVGRQLLATSEDDAAVDNATVVYESNNKTSDGCMVYAAGVMISGTEFKGVPECKIGDNNTMEVTFGDAVLSFKLSTVHQMWSMTKAVVGSQEMSQVPDISAPNKFSYHCNEGLKFGFNKTSAGVLIFKRLQIQLFNFDKPSVFGMPYDCTGFFTGVIWTGLLLSLLLISVTVYGLSMLSNIQTFDLYDDPKGKPLQINVSD